MKPFRDSALLSGIADSVPQAFWTRDAEASASSDASAFCYDFIEDVGILAVVEAIGKLVRIERQIFLAHVVVRAALRERPQRFDVIGVNVPAHIFATRIANGFVRDAFAKIVVVLLSDINSTERAGQSPQSAIR